MPDIKPLDGDQVYRRCRAETLDFETTADLEALAAPIGQERLLDALRFGTGIENHGFNLFVLGPRGFDRHTPVQRFLKDRATSQPAPPDWCYVHNFAEPNCPQALQLDAGRGQRLRAD